MTLFVSHKTILSLLVCCLCLGQLYGARLNVGTAFPYKTIRDAALVARPGDSIVCLDAVMPGGMYIENLKGSIDAPIYILAASATPVTIRGGSNSLQLSDCAFLHIEGFIFEGQTGNGLNIDDGGTYDTPTHHILIRNCMFRNIQATGNNDLLKLSGLDHFEISRCQFLNGAAGGSGIDMVGCHYGLIAQNEFTNLGSNAIQAKGGTSDLEIVRNRFENAGARALNIGGSTGLAFFRPQDAVTEAERIKVVANVFSGSEAPIAFVGCRDAEVSNNTFLFPKKWVIRILQETVDPTRFLPCGSNAFYNNIIVIDNAVSTAVNIGPNTAPQTFVYASNLWFHTTNPAWPGPVLTGSVTNQWAADPLFQSGPEPIPAYNSPARSRGLAYANQTLDFTGQLFYDPPTLGAYEIVQSSALTHTEKPYTLLFPNPFDANITLKSNHKGFGKIRILDSRGILVWHAETTTMEEIPILTSQWPAGVYYVVNESRDGVQVYPIVKAK